MGYFFIICRLLLFFVSNLGFWEHFRRKSQMNLFFLPAFTVCLHVSILFCAGILNCLEISARAIFCLGIGLAVYYLHKDCGKAMSVYLNMGYTFLAVSFFVIMAVCRGRLFMRYDNFSHWALVVKSMLMTNRYPSFRDAIIGFQEYPLGSSSYIYYFAKTVWKSEGFQMAAQGFMMLAFILPVFRYVKRMDFACFLYIALFTRFVFHYNIYVTDLLVDTLLPLQGMATLLFLYSECLAFGEKIEKRVSVLYSVPFLCASMQIKNSGVFFVLIACFLIFISLRHNRERIKEKIIAMIAPWISLYLWHAHCAYVFLSSVTSKHAMTAENFKAIFFQKTEDDIRRILTGVLKFSVTGKDLYYLILFFCFLGLLSFLANSEMRKMHGKLMMVSIALYIGYMTGMLGMYLFSMPGGESVGLAGIGRYRKTILVAVYYLTLLSWIMLAFAIDGRRKRAIYMITTSIVLIINCREAEKDLNKSPNETRMWIQRAIDAYDIPVGASYAICIPSGEGGYAYYLCKYLLYSDSGSSMVIAEESQLEAARNYEYVFLYDRENEIIQEWVRDNYPDQAGNSVIMPRRQSGL